MESAKIFLLLLCLVELLSSKDVVARSGGGGCTFPAIYNFGDSNSDTGGRSASLVEVQAPNGESFFGEPSGRACDGRLVIDFIAEELRLPYLNAYLDSIGTNFRHGANFATGGSSIRPGGYSPFHLGIQINQFLRFKSRTTALYNHLKSVEKLKSSLPRPEDFSKALYTIDIGQNDLSYGFQHTDGNEELVTASIPDILNTFSSAVQVLYKEGARYFWVHNTGPIGCLPNSVVYDRFKPGNLDKYGCIVYQNRVAQDFNRQLKFRVSQLSTRLHHTAFTYLDMYSAKLDLITMSKSLGFSDPQKFCCGSYYGYHRIDCGEKEIINGTVYGDHPCGDPSKFISWDGIHYSQRANLLIANRILNGSSSDPPNPMSGACHSGKHV